MLALLVVTIWGTSFTAIKLGLGSVPPLLLAALRFAFAALPAIFLVCRPAVSVRYWIAYGLTVGVGQFGCLFSAIHLGMPAGAASVVLQSQALFTVLFAAILLREPVSRAQLAGLGIAAAGLYLVGHRNCDIGINAIPLAALLLTIAGAAFWGISNIIVRKATAAAAMQGEQLDMLGMVVWSSLVPPLPLFLLALAMDTPETVFGAITALNWTSMLSVLYLALVATLFGFGTWSKLLSRHPASQVAPLSMLVPVTGLLTARIVLGERLSLLQWGGCLLVITGLLVSAYGVQNLRRLLQDR